MRIIIRLRCKPWNLLSPNKASVDRDIRCGGKALFSYLNEVLHLRHIGWVGHNGVGKTALTHWLAGDTESSGGR